MQALSLCWAMTRASIRGQMQYRFSFVVAVLAGLLHQALGIVMIWAILDTFTSMNGWGFDEIALLYGIRLTGHGLYLTFFSNIFSIDDMVREGRWDRLLVRPVHPMLQMMFTDFRITVLGDLFGGLAILIAALSRLDLNWSPAQVALLLGGVAAAGLLDGAFQLLPASLTFKFIDSMPARVITDDIFSRFGNYPTDIFGRVATKVLTFIIPLGFVAWLPVATMLNKHTFLPNWIGWCSFPIGVLVFANAMWVFNRSSRAYQSSGS